MKKWITLAVLLVFSTAGILFARYHQPGPMSREQRFGASNYNMMSQWLLKLLDSDQFKNRLKITQDQADHLRQIIVGAQEASIKDRAQLQVDGLQLREMLRADRPDQDAVMKKIQQISESRGQMMKDNVKALLQAKQVLNPDQQKQIRELMRHRAEGWMWGPGHFRNGHSGPGPHASATPEPPSPPTSAPPQAQ